MVGKDLFEYAQSLPTESDHGAPDAVPGSFFACSENNPEFLSFKFSFNSLKFKTFFYFYFFLAFQDCPQPEVSPDAVACTASCSGLFVFGNFFIDRFYFCFQFSHSRFF